ncbi:hypothetical protein HY78_07395 [Rhizorhabdus wittichii DC-6]|nr:hypothetical protein HY78_07395 [Rhizorhabdus wittichii DC-6]
MSSFDSSTSPEDAILLHGDSLPDPTVHDPARRRSILITVCIALMAVIAAVTGLNVAQPHLALDLGASQSQVLWMINLYAISLASLLLPLGAVGDRWGRKPVLLIGLAVFGVANIGSALAPSVEVMLGARFLSGVGAAMIMPVTLSVITSAFPDEERSKAIGIWTGVAGAGGILGMFLSAVLVDFLSWRWLFALPVVLVAVAAVMALRAVPNSRQSSEHRFDTVGSVLSLLAIMGASFVLHEVSIGVQTGPPIGAQKGPPFQDGARLIGHAPLRCARRREGGARPEARAAQSILIPVCSGDQFRFLKRQLSLPVSMMSQ